MLIDLRTLLGGDGPAHLGGYGSITAETARRIAADDIRFRRLVFDPLTGKPVDVSPDTYELDASTRRWIEARDRWCMFPGCCRRAVYCDADHAVEFPEGKTTCDNCGLLCRKHHNLKTKKSWRLHRNEDDSVDWISPLRFRYYSPPSTYEEFVDLPDPPDPRAIEQNSPGEDPDPPDDDYVWPEDPPPATDEREVHYDKLARFWRGSKDWEPIAS